MVNSKNYENRSSKRIDLQNFKHKEIQCPDCGIMFPTTVEKCKSCGKVLYEPVLEETIPEKPPIPIELENLNSYKKILKINGIIFFAISILIVIIMIAMNYL